MTSCPQAPTQSKDANNRQEEKVVSAFIACWHDGDFKLDFCMINTTEDALVYS